MLDREDQRNALDRVMQGLGGGSAHSATSSEHGGTAGEGIYAALQEHVGHLQLAPLPLRYLSHLRDPGACPSSSNSSSEGFLSIARGRAVRSRGPPTGPSATALVEKLFPTKQLAQETFFCSYAKHKSLHDWTEWTERTGGDAPQSYRQRQKFFR